MASLNARDHQEMEEELRLRVEQATSELKRIDVERERVFSSSGGLDTPDEVSSAQRVLRLQQQAIQRLREALHQFQMFTNTDR